MTSTVKGAPLAPFEVVTRPGTDYVVKLVKRADVSQELILFVRGGSKLKVEVPLGSYMLRYAAGKDWYGSSLKFGPGDMTTYFAADTEFDFYVDGDFINGNVVELIMQSSGNLHTHQIAPSAF